MSKPRVFIASSTERLDVAYAVQENLDYDAECTVWTQGVMRLSKATTASLVDQLQQNDFGIFVLGPDDVLLARGEEHSAARDNVILEIGMFAGRLGIERTFLVKPRGRDIHLPTDLLGLGVSEYSADRQDGNLTAALGPATNAMRREMREFRAQEPAPTVRVAQSFRQVDWTRLLTNGQSSLRIAVHYFDSWVNANLTSLSTFVRQPGATVEVVVTDPRIASNMKALRLLFPESSEAVLLEKVSKTGKRFLQVLDELDGDRKQLRFFMSPRMLTYSAQCVDDRILVLSIFESHRKSRIDSPAFEIDLESAPQIRNFWQKEWAGIVSESREVDPLEPLE